MKSLDWLEKTAAIEIQVNFTSFKDKYKKFDQIDFDLSYFLNSKKQGDKYSIFFKEDNILRENKEIGLKFWFSIEIG